MAPTLGNTALEMVRVGKHVSLTPYVMDGETEALRRDLSHSDFGVESVIGLNFQLRKKKKSPSPNETCSASYASKISINNNNSKKNSPASAEDIRDTGSIPGSGRFPGEGIFNPLQYSCLVNPMDRGAWQAAVHGVMKSRTQLSMHECIHKGWLLMDR